MNVIKLFCIAVIDFNIHNEAVIHFNIRNDNSTQQDIQRWRRLIHVSFLISILTADATTGNSQIKQSVNGIFLTQHDFDHKNIFLSSATDKDNYLTQRLDQVIVVRNGKRKKKFGYRSIYGYVQNGFRYRAYGGRWDALSTYGYYKIVDEQGLVLYSKWYQSSTTGWHLWYYYSSSLHSDIKRINEKNISTDFSAFPEFVEAMLTTLQNDHLFKSDTAVRGMNEMYCRFVMINDEH